MEAKSNISTMSKSFYLICRVCFLNNGSINFNYLISLVSYTCTFKLIKCLFMFGFLEREKVRNEKKQLMNVPCINTSCSKFAKTLNYVFAIFFTMFCLQHFLALTFIYFLFRYVCEMIMLSLSLFNAESSD